jgi:microcystin-dependent protein
MYALRELIQQDPRILHNVTLTTSNTPLHIAALLGHAEFAMVVMQCCPQFATELHEQGVIQQKATASPFTIFNFEKIKSWKKILLKNHLQRKKKQPKQQRKNLIEKTQG